MDFSIHAAVHLSPVAATRPLPMHHALAIDIARRFTRTSRILGITRMVFARQRLHPLRRVSIDLAHINDAIGTPRRPDRTRLVLALAIDTRLPRTTRFVIAATLHPTTRILGATKRVVGLGIDAQAIARNLPTRALLHTIIFALAVDIAPAITLWANVVLKFLAKTPVAILTTRTAPHLNIRKLPTNDAIGRARLPPIRHRIELTTTAQHHKRRRQKCRP